MKEILLQTLLGRAKFLHNVEGLEKKDELMFALCLSPNYSPYVFLYSLIRNCPLYCRRLRVLSGDPIGIVPISIILEYASALDEPIAQSLYNNTKAWGPKSSFLLMSGLQAEFNGKAPAVRAPTLKKNRYKNVPNQLRETVISKKITVIIPVKERKKAESVFHSRSGQPYKSIIVFPDGIRDRNSNIKELEKIDENGNSQLLSGPKQYSERVSAVVHSIETPYCILVGDDDVIYPQYLARAERILSLQPDISSVSGRIVDVGMRDGKPAHIILPGQDSTFSLNAIDRMYDVSYLSANIVNTVVRTDIWKKIFSGILEYGITDKFFEIAAHLGPPVFGFISNSNSLSIVRFRYPDSGAYMTQPHLVSLVSQSKSELPSLLSLLSDMLNIPENKDYYSSHIQKIIALQLANGYFNNGAASPGVSLTSRLFTMKWRDIFLRALSEDERNFIDRSIINHYQDA